MNSLPDRSEHPARPDYGTDARTRSYSWTDPAALGAAVRAGNGLEVLRNITDGRLPRPPVLDLLGIEPERIDPGVAVFTLGPQRWQYNPLGTVHGGVLATLADTALGCAVHSSLPAGTGYTTLEIKVNYIKAVTDRTGTITATGTVVSLGRRTATAEARICDGNGALICHATTTCLLFPPAA